MFKKFGIGSLAIAVLLHLIFWKSTTDIGIIFGLLVPFVFVWIGGILLFIQPQDMSIKKKMRDKYDKAARKY